MVKKLVNVYMKYPGLFGFGDYLRGSIYLLDYCQKNKLEFDMDFFDHPIGDYLNNSRNYQINKKDVIMMDSFKECDNLCLDHLIIKDKINKIKKDVIFFSINPILRNKIDDKQKKIILSKIEPNNFLQSKINSSMIKLQIEPKKYSVVHIRIDDRFTNSDFHINQLINQINILLSNKLKNNNKYLLLSSSKELKLIIVKKFPQLLIEDKEITHIGKEYNSDDIINSLVDFYLIYNSANIFQLSEYAWGSGFSFWCSYLNNIPFQKVQILDNNINLINNAIIQEKMEKIKKQLELEKEQEVKEVKKENVILNISSLKNNIIKHKLINKYK
jgi:hypothetical protein